MRHLLLLMPVLAGGVMAHSVAAMPMPGVNVPAMANASNLVVVGRVAAVQNNFGQRQISQTFEISVDRVLRGAAAALSAPVSVALTPSTPGYAAVAERQYGIFFLQKQTSGGVYTAADPFHVALPAAPTRIAGQPKSADTLTSVAQELAGVLTAPAASLTNPNGVGGLVTAAPTDQAQYVYYEAATALATIPYATAASALEAAAMSNQASARLWGAYALFSMSDAGDDGAKVECLRSLTPLLVNPLPDTSFAVSMLANAIEGRLSSPNAVPTLAALLGSSATAVRQAAASDLSDIATPDAVAPLASAALYDADQTVRYFAVLGLATAAADPSPPTLAFFKQNERDLLAYWRRWARMPVQ